MQSVILGLLEVHADILRGFQGSICPVPASTAPDWLESPTYPVQTGLQ